MIGRLKLASLLPFCFERRDATPRARECGGERLKSATRAGRRISPTELACHRTQRSPSRTPRNYVQLVASLADQDCVQPWRPPRVAVVQHIRHSLQSAVEPRRLERYCDFLSSPPSSSKYSRLPRFCTHSSPAGARAINGRQSMARARSRCARLRTSPSLTRSFRARAYCARPGAHPFDACAGRRGR